MSKKLAEIYIIRKAGSFIVRYGIGDKIIMHLF